MQHGAQGQRRLTGSQQAADGFRQTRSGVRTGLSRSSRAFGAVAWMALAATVALPAWSQEPGGDEGLNTFGPRSARAI